MTEPFTPKQVFVPGLPLGLGVNQQLQESGQQQRARSDTPVNSAIGQEDAIVSSGQSDLKRAAAAVPGTEPLPPDPATDGGLFGGVGRLEEGSDEQVAAQQAYIEAAEEREERARKRLERHQRAATQQEALRRALNYRSELLPPPRWDAEALQGARGDLAEATAAREALESGKVRVEQTWWRNVVDSGLKATSQLGVNLPKSMLIGLEIEEKLLRKALGGNTNAPTLGELVRQTAIKGIEQDIAEALPGDPARAQDFLTKLSAGGGSFAAFLLASVATGGVGAALTGALAQGAEGFEDAERSDATDAQKYIAFLLNAGLGVSEAVPIERMFLRADAMTGGAVRRILRGTTAGSLEEFTQEVAQTLGSDIIALASYDPDRELDALQYLESGIIGGILGGAAGGVIAGVGGGRQEAPGQQQQEQLIQAALEKAAQQQALQDDFDAMMEPLEADTPVSAAGVVERPAEQRSPPAARSGPLDVPTVQQAADTARALRDLNVEVDLNQLAGLEIDLGAVQTAIESIGIQVGEDGSLQYDVQTARDVLDGLGLPGAQIMQRVAPFPGGTPPRIEKDGFIHVAHWAHEPRDVLDPAMQGTGPVRGAERNRLAGLKDIQRVYYGVEPTQTFKPTADKPFHTREDGYLKEAGLGPIRHVVKIDPATVYNAVEDPLGIRATLTPGYPPSERTTEFEQKVKAAGFEGMYFPSTDHGQVLQVFSPQQPASVIDDRTGRVLAGEDSAVGAPERVGRKKAVQPEDFTSWREDIEKGFWSAPYDTLERSGWAIVTAVQEAHGDHTSDFNKAQLAKLEKELEGTGAIPVDGMYRGTYQGRSWIVFMSEKKALELGKRYGQESILTNKGLIFADGRKVDADHGATLIGDEATGEDFYSTLPDGTAFTLGLDIDQLDALENGDTDLMVSPDLSNDSDMISGRFPTQKQSTEDPRAEVLHIGTEAMKAAPKAFEHNTGLLRRYPNWQKSNRTRNPDKVADEFKEHVKGNLVALYNAVDPMVAERTKTWYDGARLLTRRWADRYKLPDRAVAAIIASLSPQNPWQNNVTMTERILDTLVYHADTEWSPQMTDYVNSRMPDTAKDMMKEIGGRSLRALIEQDAPVALRGLWLRVFDGAHLPATVYDITPEGEFTNYVVGTRMWFATGPTIKKIFKILEDPSTANINMLMGTRHKIRNFYNNIIAPRNADAITVDTHAVAAGLLRPLSGSSFEVLHALGTSPSGADLVNAKKNGFVPAKSAGVSGATGTYGLYADAYREAAAEIGILPRELQSVTWEAIRGIFGATDKRSEEGAAGLARELWKDYRNGDRDIDEVRATILADGAPLPDWAVVANASDIAQRALGVPVDGVDATPQPASYPRDLSGAGVPGGDAGAVDAGARAGAAEALPEDIEAQTAPEPLPGSYGPVPAVVEAAEAYAAEAGIPIRRQAEYVKIDTDRGARIAEAYEAMEHNPNDPEVAAAYDALIDETLAQYQAVKASGLQVEFVSEKDWLEKYPNGPRDVIEDIRENNHLWLLPTDSGFGQEGLEPADNPLLRWTDEYTSDGHRMRANDVFRAVHDYFGHGLEGAGFGPRGEENAWQAHSRLFTDKALPALTSETRGQNSWVNFGPHGEHNRTNQQETIYAEQKTGLMPPWTWQEGVSEDAQSTSAADVEAQTGRGRAPLNAERSRPRQGVPADPAADVPDATVSYRQIADNLQRLMQLTIRQGRLVGATARVLGQYNRKSQTIRVRSRWDLSTIAHEAGHYLNDDRAGVFDSWVQDQQARLRRIGEALYPDYDGLPTNEKKTREGFAEFFRAYLLNRPYLEAQFPSVLNEFDRFLDANAPELKRGLEGIRNQYELALTQPSIDAARGIVVEDQATSGLDSVFDEMRELGATNWMKELGARALATTINKYTPLNRVVAEVLNRHEEQTGTALDLKVANDPRKIVRLVRNVGNRAMVQLSDGLMPYRGVTPNTRALRDAIAISQGYPPHEVPHIDKDRQHDFATYLTMLRSEAEYRRYQEGKLKRAPIGLGRGDVRQAIADLEAQYGDSFKEAAKIVNEYGRALWRKQYDAGLIDKKTFLTGMDREFYAPMQRDMSGTKKAGLTAVAQRGDRSIAKRFKGSDRDVIDPVQALISMTFAVEATIAENDVKKALAALADNTKGAGSLVERIPAKQIIGQQLNAVQVARKLLNDPDISETEAADAIALAAQSMDPDKFITMFRQETASPAGDNILFFWEGGKLQAIQLIDGDIGADVVNLFQALGRENMHPVLDLVAMTSTLFRQAITSWPDFLLVNFIRDQMSAWMLTDVGYVPFVSGLKGVLSELKQGEIAREFNATAGIFGGVNASTIDEARVQKDIRSIARGKGYAAKVFGNRGLAGAVKGIAKVTELTETGTRLGVYELAAKRARADGLSEWEAAVEAAYMGTDLMDFGLHGSATLAPRRLIPFLNAQLQGLYKMVRTMGGDEVAQRKGLRFALTAYFKDVNNMELSRTEKAAIRTGRKLWLKMAGIGLLGAALAMAFKDDEDYQETSEYLRTTGWVIPLKHMGRPGEVAYIPKPFELAILSNVMERGVEFAYGDEEAPNRLLRGVAMNLSVPMSPPLITTLVERQANYNFFRGREIEPRWMQAYEPYMRYNHYTSDLAKWMGRTFNWSPLMIDHALDGMGASASRDIKTMINMLNKDRPETGAADWPVTRRFIRDARRSSTTSQDFWKVASTTDGEMTTAGRSYRKQLETGNELAAERYLDTLEPDHKAWAIIDAHFTVDEKRLHPIYRARALTSIFSGLRREMLSSLGVENTSDGATADDAIHMSPSMKAEVDELLSELARREMRNTLVFMDTPGWAGKSRLDVSTTVQLLRETSPALADELQRRVAKKKVYSGAEVEEFWPDVRRRLIDERQDAILDDITSVAKSMSTVSEYGE